MTSGTVGRVHLLHGLAGQLATLMEEPSPC